MRRMQGKIRWLVLATVNFLFVIFSAVTIYSTHQDETGAALYYRDDAEDELVLVYSTAEMKRGIYEANVCYKIGGGAIHTVL